MKFFSRAISVVLPAALALALSTNLSAANPITIKADITNIIGADSGGPIATMLGLSSSLNYLTGYFTFDADQSSGAVTHSGTTSAGGLYNYSINHNSYANFSLVTPNGTTIHTNNEPIYNGIDTTDTVISNPDTSHLDQFNVISNADSSASRPYDQIRIDLSDADVSFWSRSQPITAAILNSLRAKYFVYSYGLVGQPGSDYIQSRHITFSEISAVPLPANLVLLLSGLGLLWGTGRMRTRSWPAPIGWSGLSLSA
ncbi:MAG: hypothetical protein WCB49_00010 [Gammaproteobacteria bacterium]